MSKESLIERVAADRNMTKAEAGRVVNSVLAALAAEIETGEDLRLPELGVFKTRLKAERVYRNPQTGESVVKPAHNEVRFTPAKALAEAANRG